MKQMPGLLLLLCSHLSLLGLVGCEKGLEQAISVKRAETMRRGDATVPRSDKIRKAVQLAIIRKIDPGKPTDPAAFLASVEGFAKELLGDETLNSDDVKLAIESLLERHITFQDTWGTYGCYYELVRDSSQGKPALTLNKRLPKAAMEVLLKSALITEMELATTTSRATLLDKVEDFLARKTQGGTVERAQLEMAILRLLADARAFSDIDQPKKSYRLRRVGDDFEIHETSPP